MKGLRNTLLVGGLATAMAAPLLTQADSAKPMFSAQQMTDALHLVMSSTQKVVCLYHHVCCSGEPQVVTRDPEFISLFGDDMARMMSVYHHSHDHKHHAHHHGNEHV